MLNQMPLDILKLDMKFIQSETAKPVNQGILRFIMSLARWMNLSVVAEGVETDEQLERLRESDVITYRAIFLESLCLRMSLRS